MGTLSTVDVTVISCLYGDSHDQFIDDWSVGVKHLDPFPYGLTVVACDRPRLLLGAKTVGPCTWKHKQAFYLQHALASVDTEWVWIHDIDDIALPDALAGIEHVNADVWQLGYRRSDGETYLPPELHPDELIKLDKNPFVAGSCVRTLALRMIGGFPDCALQDWALWRRLALAGCSFASSDRIHFHYRRHEEARGKRELTLDRREDDVMEMLLLEEDFALAG